MARIIDTFDKFRSIFKKETPRNPGYLLELWQKEYMKNYPELLEKQIKTYRCTGVNWKELAIKKVIPLWNENLPYMEEARDRLLKLIEPINSKAMRSLNTNLKITFLLYVGIGCGAGWAMRYKGNPSCLLGLEKIAELGWHTEDKLKGLLAHEIGHLAHMHLRGEWEEFEEKTKDPLFLLYSEGFAQRCENLILGDERWHLIQEKDWFQWCMENLRFLKKEYLARVEAGKPINEFFGDWFDIKGRKFTGYFLGYKFIEWLEKGLTLKEIAKLPFDTTKEKALMFLKEG